MYSSKLLILLLASSSVLSAAISVVQQNALSSSAPPWSLGSSTGSGHVLLTCVDSSAVPASLHTTGGTGSTFTIVDVGILPTGGSPTASCWVVSNTNSGNTTITCTTCGTVNAVYWYELSGANNATPVDVLAPCRAVGACWAPENLLWYNPSYSSEFVFSMFACGGSVTGFTGTGSTWTSHILANGEAGADATSSGFGQLSTTVTGCGDQTSLIIGIIASGSTKSCHANLGGFDYSPQGNSSAHPTISSLISHAGSLVVAMGWCTVTCGPGTMTVGSDSLTQTSVSGVSNATEGQAFLYYVLATSAAGTQNLVFTPTGSWTNDQNAYISFITGPGCQFVHDVDSSLGSGGPSVTSATTPSYSPTAGDVMFNFTWVGLHCLTVNSPWQAHNYALSGENNSLFTNTTVNSLSYNLSAPGGSQANNIGMISSSYQALLTSFKVQSTTSSVSCSTTLLGTGPC